MTSYTRCTATSLSGRMSRLPGSGELAMLCAWKRMTQRVKCVYLFIYFSRHKSQDNEMADEGARP